MIRDSHAYLLCLSLLCTVIPVRSAPIEHASPLKRFGVENRLSNNFITAICEDPSGTIWIATEEGLNKFDGIQLSSYYKHTGDLTGNGLNDILADRDLPRIWIATQRDGLGYYDYQSATFGAYRHDATNPDGLITDDITHLEQDSDNNLWMSTYHQGMECLDKQTGKFIHYNPETVPGMSSRPIYTFELCADSLICIGHYQHGVTLFNPQTRQVSILRHDASDPESLPSDEVYSIYRDCFGRIWVGTGAGLALLRPATRDFVRIPLPGAYSGSRVYSILLREDGTLLLGLEFNGVFALDPDSYLYGSARHIREGGSLSGTDKLARISVRCVHEDRYRNLWLGTYGDGLSFQSNRQYTKCGTWQYPEQLSENNTWGLCFDNRGRLWAGTDGGGINLLSDGRPVARYKQELSGNAVITACRDSEGTIWLGTYPGTGTIFDYRDGGFRQLSIPGCSADIRCFCENEDQMWIGSSNGIFVLDRKSRRVERQYTTADGLPDNLIRALLFDDKERLWVGTFGNGLAVYDQQMREIKRFTTSDGLHSNEINHLHRDHSGNVWAATGEGIVRLDAQTPSIDTCYRRKEGLQNDHIRAISEDENHNIWFSTNTGICCIDQTGNVFNFDHRDGVTTGTFMSGSVARADDGLICFGSTRGITYFYANQMLADREFPPVRFTEIRIIDNASHTSSNPVVYPVVPQKPVKLNHRQNNFTVLFGVPDYSFVDKIEYSYKLLDTDQEWYMVDAGNSVTFRHVQPGSYRLQIRARIRNQQWNTQIASLEIQIAPPAWLTWWAKCGYLITILAGIWTLMMRYKRRLKHRSELRYERESWMRRQEINDERLRFYTNITHELRTPLTLIMGPLEELENDEKLAQPASRKVGTIHRSAKQLLTLINQLLEFRETETQNRPLSIRHDDLSQCVEETGLLFRDSSTNRATTIELEIEQGVAAHFDAKIVTVILNNLLSNALKYTPKGKVTVFLHTLEEQGIRYAEFGVHDTGYGIKPEALNHIFDRYYQVNDKNQASGTGIGLALVKNLVELHEATIEVESKPGEGSLFRIRLRLDNTYPQSLHPDLLPSEGRETPTQGNFAEPDKSEDSRPIVLVVDDNADIRAYIAESLSEQYRTLTAKDGAEGIALAQESIPDLVVSDIMMPVMDGFELCGHLKQDVRTSHIPIILLTAKDTPTDKTRGYDLGADSYITKPFSSSLLLSRIRNLLDSRQKIARRLVSSDTSKQERATQTLMPLDNEFLQRLTTLIEEQMSSEKLDVAYLSENLHMSSSTLYRKLKGLVGISTNEYIRKIRLHKAAEMLRSGRYNVSEVIWQIGMSSAVYFRQCFKDEYGLSPSEYKRQETGLKDPDE